ncbi:hypothetical protein NEIG_00582 [Nematocida sp. ERTm5]|nr:hypothetical protein NEIG_00582 [Nematocida sp. ERTm5]
MKKSDRIEKDDLFEFDAPQMKDFMKKEYQTQKRVIEELLETRGNPGVPQDPSKEIKKKPVQVLKPAPRKTFFSEIFKKTSTVHKPEIITSIHKPEEDFNESVDDGWFKKKENEIEVFSNISVKGVHTQENDILTTELFMSDEEVDILPQLKVMATPPIKRMKREVIHSAEFSHEDIEELTKTFKEAVDE